MEILYIFLPAIIILSVSYLSGFIGLLIYGKMVAERSERPVHWTGRLKHAIRFGGAGFLVWIDIFKLETENG